MDLIKEYHHVLDKEFCNDIIRIYHQSDQIKQGVTFSGLNTSIKKTFDLHFINIETEKIIDYDSKLYLILNKYLNEYLKDFTNLQFEYIDKGFQIQRYIINDGFYTYHNDSHVDIQLKEERILTYIFYLNTVEEGGETEFFRTSKIKAECGKLVLFPACWCFPHRGLMPISNDKYIITGWIYRKIYEYEEEN